MVRRRHLSHATLLCGPPPEGTIGFGIPDPKTKTSVDGDVAGPKTICHVAAHREIDLFTSGDFISIAVDQELLLEALREQGVDTSALIERFTTELPRNAMARLQSCARDILSAFEVEPDLIGRPAVGLTMRKQLVTALVESLVEGCARPSRSTLPSRVQAVKRVRDYVMAHSRAPITVVDLSRVAGVSPRTLRNGFHEQFGIGPKAYLTALRLSSARRSLREAAPSSTTVTEVALENGFWHLGRFAQAYRRHFGELPTTTLNRAPRKKHAASMPDLAFALADH